MLNKDLMPQSKAKNAYDLLSEVREVILEEPRRYDQGDWIRIQGNDKGAGGNLEYPRCGTIGCVAGWVVALKSSVRELDNADSNFYWNVEEKAQKILGLDNEEANKLFASEAADGTDPQTKEHAKAGAAHIRRFQRQYAKELKATKV